MLRNADAHISSLGYLCILFRIRYFIALLGSFRRF